MEKEYDVFISYSRKDFLKKGSNDIRDIDENSVVSKLIRALKAAGLRYWYDKDGVSYSDRFLEIIGEAIKQSRILLFVSTKNSNSSRYVSQELASAVEYNVPIFAFRADDTPYDHRIVAYCAGTVHVKFSEFGEKAFEIVASGIKEKIKKDDEVITTALREIDALERKLNEVKQQYNAQIQIVRKLGIPYKSRAEEVKIAELETQLDVLQQTVKGLQFQCDNLNEKLKKKESELKSAIEELAAIRAERDALLALKHQLEEESRYLRQTINGLNEQIRQLTITNNELQERIRDLLNTVQNQTGMLRTKDSEIEVLRSESKHHKKLSIIGWFLAVLFLAVSIVIFFRVSSGTAIPAPQDPPVEKVISQPDWSAQPASQPSQPIQSKTEPSVES